MARPGAGADGRLPAWIGQRAIAVWRNLTQRNTAEPDLPPWSDVQSLGSAVHVDADAARRIAGSDRLEPWLRDYLIDKLPGAGTNPKGTDQSAGDRRDSRSPRLDAAPPGARKLSQLLGAHAVSRDGRLAGSVVRVFTTLPGERDASEGPITFRARRGPRPRAAGQRPADRSPELWLLMEHERPGRSSEPPLLGRLVRARARSTSAFRGTTSWRSTGTTQAW